VKSNNGSTAKPKATSGHWNDYFSFKPSENDSASSMENVCCIINVIKPLHIMDLTLRSFTTCNMRIRSMLFYF